MSADYSDFKKKLGYESDPGKPKTVFDWPLTLKYRGPFDYDGLMNVIRSYFAKNKFDKLDEPKFKYKMGGGGKAEVEFQFTSEMKATGFTKMYLILDGHLWDVERGKQSNGKIELKIQAGYVHDYGKGFNPNKKSQRWMAKTIFNPNTGEGVALGDLKGEGKKNAERIGNGLLDEIKSFIGVECL